jgi:hypothetical protein
MDLMILWNSALSLFVAIIGFFLKEKFSELLDRLDRLDEKLDRLMEIRNAK